MDFPLPDGPITARISPGEATPVTPQRIVRSCGGVGGDELSELKMRFKLDFEAEPAVVDGSGFTRYVMSMNYSFIVQSYVKTLNKRKEEEEV